MKILKVASIAISILWSLPAFSALTSQGLSEDKQLIISFEKNDSKSEISIIERQTNTVLHRLSLPADSSMYRLSPDNKILAYTTKKDFQLNILDLESGKTSSVKADGRLGPNYVGFRPDSKQLLFTTRHYQNYGNNGVHTLDLNTMEMIQVGGVMADEHGIKYALNGKVIVIQSDKYSVNESKQVAIQGADISIWDIKTKTKLRTVELPKKLYETRFSQNEVRISRVYDRYITAVLYSIPLKGERVKSSQVLVWSVDTGKLVYEGSQQNLSLVRFINRDYGSTFVRMSPGMKVLAVISDTNNEKQVSAIDLSAGQKIWEAVLPNQGLQWDFEFNKNGTKLVSVASNAEDSVGGTFVTVIDPKTGSFTNPRKISYQTGNQMLLGDDEGIMIDRFTFAPEKLY